MTATAIRPTGPFINLYSPNEIRIPDYNDIVFPETIQVRRQVDGQEIEAGVHYDAHHLEFILDIDKLSPRELDGKITLMVVNEDGRWLCCYYMQPITGPLQLWADVACLEASFSENILQYTRDQLIEHYVRTAAKYTKIYDSCRFKNMLKDLKIAAPANLPTVEHFAATLVGSETEMVRAADKATKLVQSFFEMYLNPHIARAIG